MTRSRWFVSSIPALAAIAALVFWSDLHRFLPSITPRTPEQRLAGSASCRGCHAAFHDKWSTSMHGLSVRVFDDAFAVAFLPDTSIIFALPAESASVTFRSRDGVMEVRREGRTNEHRVTHVVGGRDVFYFLTELDRGRIQTLPIAYDVRDSAWFHTGSANVRHFSGDANDAALPWTDRAFTFNNACFRCHVSQARSSYDPTTDVYATSWAEPGINCETCHGPAADHVRVFSSPTGGTTRPPLSIISVKRFRPDQANALCTPCHARMLPLTEKYSPGDALYDHFDVATWEDPDVGPDGRDMGENYTYSSWLASPCRVSEKFTCLHCHTSSGRFKFADRPDYACLPCHAEVMERTSSHSHHVITGKGARCIDCHMLTTAFARMRRSDHSMRAPVPAATLRFGTPNACNGCHADKSTEWADRTVRRWYKRDYQRSVLDDATLIAEARSGDWKNWMKMKERIVSPKRGEVMAASLLRLMMTWQGVAKTDIAGAAFSDPSPLVRAAAARALSGMDDPEAERLLLEASHDPVRVVRVRAAESYSSIPIQRRRLRSQASLDSAMLEYRRSLEARPDDHLSIYNLGNSFAAVGDDSAAIAAYSRALRLRPEFVSAWVNAAFSYDAQGDSAGAERSLRTALSYEPKNVAANLNLGLLLAVRGEVVEGEEKLRTAYAVDTLLGTAAYNLAVLAAPRDVHEAIVWIERAVRAEPRNAKFAYAHALYLRDAGEISASVSEGERSLQRGAGSVDLYALLSELYRVVGKSDLARSTLLRGARDTDLSYDDRKALELQAQQFVSRSSGD